MTAPLGTVNDMWSMDAAGRPRPEAARVLRASRNTVAKYAEMEDVSPAASTPQRRGRPALEGNEEWVAGVLETDPGAPRKRRRTARRIYDRLIAERGYAGPCSTARRFARELRLALAAAGGGGTSSSSRRPAPARAISGTPAPRPAGGPSTPGCRSRRPRTRTTRSAPPSCRRGRAVVLAHHRRPGGVAGARHPEAGGVPGGPPRGGEARPRGLEARGAAQALRAAGAQDLRRPRLVGRAVAGGHGARVVGGNLKMNISA